MNFKDSKNDSTALRNPLGMDGNGRNENATFPLTSSDGGLDADSSLDPLAGAETAKRSSAGTLLIIAVIVVAAGGLFSMRFLAKVHASSQTDTDLEKNIASYLAMVENGKSGEQGDLFRADTTVLNVLKESYTEHQVPWENVARDPFDLSGGSPDIVAPVAGDTTNHQWEQQRREKLQAMESAGKSLELTSVLLGARPLANINGKIVRINDLVHVEKDGVDFRVSAIEKDKATLVGEDPALNVRYEITVGIVRE